LSVSDADAAHTIPGRRPAASKPEVEPVASIGELAI
jgi:hypothetical protein